MLTDCDIQLAAQLTEAIRFFSSKGWSPATSTNYSVRSQASDGYIISRSGVDKSNLVPDDLILIDREGSIRPPFNRPGIKSSAETEIHTALYGKFQGINCILHTHSVLGTVLSRHFLPQGKIEFSGLEIIKGLDGNMTHEMTETLPIVPNSQYMPDIIGQVKKQFDENPKLHGFLIEGHGLYTWGKDIPTAKRHVETFEFLFECFNAMRRL